MPRIVLTLTSPLFDEDQEVSIRENLPARTLLAEIRKEYNLTEGNFLLQNKSNGKMIDPEKTLEQSGIQTGAVIVFNAERRAPMRMPLVQDVNVRRPIMGSVRAFLKEEETGQIYDIPWQPAVIGRPDANHPESAETLAVNLGASEAAKSVSRAHARLLEQNGLYYLEPLAEHNPTFLNDGVVRLGERRVLEPGDKITVGKISLIFDTKQAVGGESTDVQRRM